jgi:ATP-binding cassette, subfamily B, bacterial PglK
MLIKNHMPVNKLLINLWRNLEKFRQRQFLILMILTLIGTVADAISLGMVLPFLSVLIMPEKIFNYPLVESNAKLWGINDPDQLLLPLTLGFISVAFLSAGVRLFLLKINTKFAFACGADLSIKAYSRTLYQPYIVHITRNSSEVISSILTKVDNVVNWTILPILTFINSAALLIAIMATLLFIDWAVAISSIVGFGMCYGVITCLFRHQLRLNAQRIANEQTQVTKALQEGLSGIRDVLLDGTQTLYCDIYQRADRPLRRAYASNIFIAGSPRFIMEALGMALIAGLAYTLSHTSEGIESALPLLGALALGAQRFLPALQQGYSSWTSIVGSSAALEDTLTLLNQSIPKELSRESKPLSFKKTICFNRVRFRYSNNSPWVIDDFNLKISKGMRIGIVGPTGSGKSTAMDLLIGLLEPTEGELLIDGVRCVGNVLQDWKKTIAHVPQNIYLADITLAENIAFGVPIESIDMKRVEAAARQAQIANFIESQPQAYKTKVGERGIRLSGGQLQRIGIARALYKEAKVLVFDEATSALDSVTETFVIDAIENLDRHLTIFLIAHRVTTLNRCDLIIKIEDGRIVRQGSFEEVLGE